MIAVTLVDVRGDHVRIGVNLPPHLGVHRKESSNPMKDGKE
jgi:sRNA-binding carbon storage regulator CsrA